MGIHSQADLKSETISVLKGMGQKMVPVISRNELLLLQSWGSSGAIGCFVANDITLERTCSKLEAITILGRASL
jgi:hypothetical protein